MIKEIRARINQICAWKRFTKANPGVYVDSSLQLRLPQYISCGKEVHLGENTKLLCWDRYGKNKEKLTPRIVIGDNVFATRNFVVQCANSVVVGSNVLIASNVFVVDFNHGMSPLTDSYLDNPLAVSAGVEIKDGAWIGNNVIVLPGVTIGKKSVIGAGSVVTKSVPDYAVAVGNPARVVKVYDFEKACWVKAND